MTPIVKLDGLLKAVAPIDGVSIGRFNDKSSWRIDFKDEATLLERTAAQAVIVDFDLALAEREVSDAIIAAKAAKQRIRDLPDNTPVTAKDLREAGLI